VRGRSPEPIDERTDFSLARVGVEPTACDVLSVAGLPFAYRASSEGRRTKDEGRIKNCLFHPSSFLRVAQVGVEPTAFRVLSANGLPVAYRAAAVPEVGIEPTSSGSEPDVTTAKPLRNYRYFISIQVRGEGVEPSQAASKAASLPLADPRSQPLAA
jgi:hypothetical protein